MRLGGCGCVAWKLACARALLGRLSPTAYSKQRKNRPMKVDWKNLANETNRRFKQRGISVTYMARQKFLNGEGPPLYCIKYIEADTSSISDASEEKAARASVADFIKGCGFVFAPGVEETFIEDDIEDRFTHDTWAAAAGAAAAVVPVDVD